MLKNEKKSLPLKIICQMAPYTNQGYFWVDLGLLNYILKKKIGSFLS